MTGLVFLGPFGLRGALRRRGGSADRRRLAESRTAPEGPLEGAAAPRILPAGWFPLLSAAQIQGPRQRSRDHGSPAFAGEFSH